RGVVRLLVDRREAGAVAAEELVQVGALVAEGARLDPHPLLHRSVVLQHVHGGLHPLDLERTALHVVAGALAQVPVARDRHHAESHVEADVGRLAGGHHHAAQLRRGVGRPAALEQRPADPPALVLGLDHQLGELLHPLELDDPREPRGLARPLADPVAAALLGGEELDELAVAAPARAHLALCGHPPRGQHAALHGGVVDRPLRERESAFEIGGGPLAEREVGWQSRHGTGGYPSGARGPVMARWCQWARSRPAASRCSAVCRCSAVYRSAAVCPGPGPARCRPSAGWPDPWARCCRRWSPSAGPRATGCRGTCSCCLWEWWWSRGRMAPQPPAPALPSASRPVGPTA